MALYDDNLQIQPDFTYQQYSQPPSPTIAPTVVQGSAPVVTINGNSGNATGPTVTVSGGLTGYSFNASGNALTLTVANPTTVRTSISAAKSGVNSDLTSFTTLTGSTGWNAWTGGSDKSSNATFSGTASAGYVQAELQAVMNSLQETTEALKALIDTLLLSGVLRP